MVNPRFLENKFRDEIEMHIKNALPDLYGTFIHYRQSDEYEDGNLCFDLIYDYSFTVSIRIRQHKYMKYNDLTIRSKSKNGNKTELDKISEGMAQVYFYAYMSEEEDRLVKIRIANVDAIRKLYNDGKFRPPSYNDDNTAFIKFRFCDIKSYGGAIYKYDLTDELACV